MSNDFDTTFEEYHDLIRKEIAKDTDLENKVTKVEQLVYLMHSVVYSRFGDEYKLQAKKIHGILHIGKYFDEMKEEVIVNNNNDNTRRRRLGILREWLSLMIREYPPFRLYGNMSKVDFD